MATEADLARWKLNRVQELLDDVRASTGRVERIRALIDGAQDDIDRLEHKAYLILPTPRTMWRRLTGSAA